MATTDNVVSIHPYFTIAEGKESTAREYCERFVALTKSEDKCLYYGFSFDGSAVHCREAYQGAEGLLDHLSNVGELLQEFLDGTASVNRLEVHGAAEEIEKLKEPLASLSPQYFTLEYGIRA
ncbi:MAG: hypothetical protein AAGB46_13035 [Verrucomicrobiota bacterium]